MLEGEKNELADRAVQRQTGTVPRHKVSATKAVTESTFFVHTPLGLSETPSEGHYVVQSAASQGGSNQRVRKLSVRTTFSSFSLFHTCFSELICPEGQLKYRHWGGSFF